MRNILSKFMSGKSKISLHFLLAAVLLSSATQSLNAQTGKGDVAGDKPQQTVQSVVSKQAALVTELDVNGLKVLIKRREGSLTVAAGLFIRGGASNINASNPESRL